MNLPAKTLEKLLKLSALDPQAEDLLALTQDIKHIIELLKTLQAVDVSAVEPLSHPLELVQPQRNDMAQEKNLTPTQLASSHWENFYLVPTIIGEP